jgi:hypothetical protein
MLDRTLDRTRKICVVVRGQKFAICTRDIFSNSSTNKEGRVYIVTQQTATLVILAPSLLDSYELERQMVEVDRGNYY